MLPHGHPAFLFLAIVPAAPVRALGARLTNAARPLAIARELCEAEVAVHHPLRRLENAAGKEELHTQLVSHACAICYQAAGGVEDVREVLGTDGGRGGRVQAADISEADLGVAGPGDFVVGEERGAHCWNGDGDVAHARQSGEEVTDVLAALQMTGVRVVKTVAGARRVLKDFEREARGFDEVEQAGDGDGADVC